MVIRRKFENALVSRDFAGIREESEHLTPTELAELISELSSEQQVLIFRVLSRKTAALTFEYLTLEQQEELLKSMGQEDVAEILNEMSPDDRTMLLEELPAAATQQLLSLLNDKERHVAVQLLGYPEDSVGRLMTPDYLAVYPEWSIRDVLRHIRKNGQDSETFNMIYVIDDQGILIDDLRMRKVILSDPDKRVFEIMDYHFTALKATDDSELAVKVFKKADLAALPVTDTEGVMIGIVTSDDILDVAEQQATEQIQMFGGSEALDEPYMDIGFFSMIRKRAMWLMILFLGEMFTATAMAHFEDELKRALVLSLFIPLIISSGGNSGSQAATLVIRALALGEVTIRDWFRVMKREIFSGLVLGSILGLIGFLRIVVWVFIDHRVYGPHYLLLALTLGFTLVGIVLWGTLAGSMLPILLRRLGLDPAVSSAPFVATLVDVTGLIIYFSIASVILRGTLL